jgi:transposase InsO family protein
MIKLLQAIGGWVLLRFRSRASLEAEVLLLRQQLGVLRRRAPKHIRPDFWDRLVLVSVYRLFPSVLSAVHIVQPATLLRWHRQGFRAYWRWRSRKPYGRPKTNAHLRSLIRQISSENPLWGAPRIHGELLILGYEVSQTTVAKYMVKRPNSSGGPTWKTFLRTHADGIASMDFVIVPTIGFKLLYCLVILDHARRNIVHYAVTHVLTAEWVARQIVEAFPCDEAPRYLVHDRDPVFNDLVRRRLGAMGIRDRPTSPRSPWQNGHVERLIGSIRRDCLDHMLIFGENHLRSVMKAYVHYYNNVRTHLSLDKNAPLQREPARLGAVHALPHLGGMHHEYVRI